MRRWISVGLVLLILAGGFYALWSMSKPLAGWIGGQWMKEEQRWLEKPATRVVASLSGASLDTIEPVARQIVSLLSPFDGQLRKDAYDSPVTRIDLSATLPPASVLPLRDLTQKMVEELAPPKARQKPRARGRAVAASRKPAGAQAREIRQKKASLMKGWDEAEKSHARVMASRRKYRHPEELLQRDEESRELKQKLVDLEMTLAEAIDHYTPSHPRVGELQQEIAAIRSSLDRRVLVAESEEEARWERRRAEFQKKKQQLERDEKRILRSGPAASATVAEESQPPEPAAEPEARSALHLTWTETQTVVRELVSEKQLDAGKLPLSLFLWTAAALLAGYVLGIAGFAGRSAPSPAGPPASPAPPELPSARAAVRARKPLPAIETPPAPEKTVDESELPGQAWVSYPRLPSVEKGLYTVFAPTSAASEFFEQSAQSLLDKLPNSQAPVVGVAAVRSGSGTSTFVANLAVSIRRSRPVVLVDLHHTAPNLHSFFSIPASSHDIFATEPWSQSVLTTPLDRVFLLPLFAPHLEKEMADLKVKKKMQAFLKESAANRTVLLDVAPLGRSDAFEEVSECCDAFVLIYGPDPVPASVKPALQRLAKAMKNKPVLRIRHMAEPMPEALAPRPAAQYEFVS